MVTLSRKEAWDKLFRHLLSMKTETKQSMLKTGELIKVNSVHVYPFEKHVLIWYPNTSLTTRPFPLFIHNDKTWLKIIFYVGGIPTACALLRGSKSSIWQLYSGELLKIWPMWPKPKGLPVWSHLSRSHLIPQLHRPLQITSSRRRKSIAFAEQEVLKCPKSNAVSQKVCERQIKMERRYC